MLTTRGPWRPAHASFENSGPRTMARAVTNCSTPRTTSGISATTAPALTGKNEVAGFSLFHCSYQENHLKRVTGIGGIFFKAKDPAALGAWYRDHLGIDVQSWNGAAFSWADDSGNPTGGTTVW